MDSYELSVKYGKAQSTIREWKQELRRKGYPIPIIKKSLVSGLPDPIRVDDANALILSDLHLPYLNIELYETAVSLACDRGVKRVVLAGDVLNFDAVSTFPAQYQAVPLREEIAIARMRLDELESRFDELICITGNHDARLAGKLGGSLGVTDIGLPGRWSNHWYCYIGSWMVVHPDSYAENLAAARSIADVYGTNVIAGHTHQWGMTKSRSGKYYVVEAGCMCDERLIPYKELRRSRGSRWASGFAILQDDICYLYDMRIAKKERGEKYDE